MLIKSNNLVIRNMCYNDISSLHRLLSDENVMLYIENVFAYDKAKEFALKYGLNDEPNVFAVDLSDVGFIGYVIYKKYHSDNTYEIGWLLFQEHWNKGYATYLTKMLIDYSMNIGIKELIIEFDKQQKYSQRIATKFNFEFVKYEDNLAIYALHL